MPGTDLIVLWPLVLAAPVLGAILSFVFPRRGTVIGLSSLVIACLGAIDLVSHVASHGVLNHTVGGWSAPLGVGLVADGLAAMFVLTTALVGLGISVYASSYFRMDGLKARRQEHYFWPLWLFLITGLEALFLTADLFNAYVAIELITFSSVALVALGGKRSGLEAAIRYLLIGLLGSLAYLLGVGLLYGAHGTVDRTLLAEAMTGGGVDSFATILMLAALLLKGAVFPLHFWLPSAHASAPAPVSAALSALVVKAAYYVILRIWFELGDGWLGRGVDTTLGVMGGCAVVWGCVQALRQARLKLLVAYSTVAQIGYLFLLFPLVGEGAGPKAWFGSVYFALSHAFAKAAIFLAAGNLMHAAGHDRIRDLIGSARVIPVSFAALALAGLNATGLPPSGAFIGKWLLMNQALETGQWILVFLLGFGGLLAVAYTLRIVNIALLNPEDLSHRRTHFHALPARMEWAPLVLAIVSVLLGLLSTIPMEVLGVGAPGGGEF